ncbi:hypothetical protein DXG03_005650 [Asterophora parasitica]|uniref:Protein kinase domain-containing protein n=1 Tax=Asterophora parasitica TaxID=117018 RepID=A0A9P7G1I0_9AGAR|nr:hypothetical protein DXG03_005650 [Asterophora parasitica]
MHTFSSITIHNCILENGVSIPVTLAASPSSPGRRYTDDYDDPPPPTVKTWAARPVPIDGSSLDVSLTGLIGEGRIGMTYSARVNATGDNVTPGTVPQEICLKFAKPQYVRSLAREAWFYEQLHKWQGISTARCFGFFSAAAAPGGALDESVVVPWKESKKVPRRRRYDPDDGSEYELPMKDYLPDEAPDPLGLYSDEHGFHRDSPWRTWEHKAESPLLAVLALEKLGSHYFMPDEEPPHRVEGLRNALRAMVDDIAQEGVHHNDITAFNILGVPKDSRTLCPRHNLRHKWRLVDFDRADKMDPQNCGSIEFERVRLQVRCIGEVSRRFWGAVED